MVTYLERVLAREALVAMAAWERLDSKMYPLVPLQVVISVEALRTLVAPKRSVILWARLLCVVSIHLLHLRGVATVEAWTHTVVHAIHHLHVAARVVDVGEHRSGKRVCVGPTVWLRVLLE